jgi:hypothetical protein
LETLLIGTSEAEYAHKQANGVKRQSIGNVGLFPHSLSVSAESDEVVRIIRKLIDVCCGQHPFCTSVPHPGTPSRLLDVGTPEEQQLRLVPWDVYSLHERPYLTLSYCWGGVPMDAPWKLTTTNLEQFMVSIPIEALPLTLREAVLLTRRLGERYIWIDSLCIIQNDRSDWVRQSSSMSRIYSGSLCTLSAASDHSNGGLFAERNSPPATTLELSPFHGGPPRKVLLYPQHRCGSDHYFQCTDKPGVYSRAWCLQERELSCRVLQFTTQEFIWKCRTEDAKECEIVGFMEARKLLSLGEPDFIDVNVSLERYSITSRDDRVKIGNYVIFKHHEYAQKLRRFYEYWYNILTEYTAASISNHADRLPALSGLARAHPVGRGNTYLAGLWKHDIRTGLSWKSRRRQNEDGSNQHYACNLPSWSPLRSDLGGVYFSSGDQTRKTVFSPVLLKAVIVHSTSDLFGHINSGYLTFKGYIVECRLCDYSDYHNTYRKNEELRFDPRRAREKDEHGGTRLNDYLYEIGEMKNIGNIRFDASEGKQCYPVVFYVHLGMPERSYCGEYEEYWYDKYTKHEPKKSVGLVVIKVSHPDHSNAYMRIGIVEGNIEPVFSSFKESIFTLL